jgi:hypothetical protein
METLYPSIEKLREDKCLRGCLQKLGKHGNLCNMECERLLSSFRKATPDKLPHAERVCAAGLLTQWLRPHLKANGNDPRTTTRANLLDAGVPLACGGVKTLKGCLHASMLYANDKLADRKAELAAQGLPAMSRDDTKRFTKIVHTAFRTEPPEVIEHYKVVAEEMQEGRIDSAKNSKPEVYDSSRRCGLCSQGEPILSERIEETFKQGAEPTNEGGLTRTATRLRNELRATSVCQDRGYSPSAFWIYARWDNEYL